MRVPQCTNICSKSRSIGWSYCVCNFEYISFRHLMIIVALNIPPSFDTPRGESSQEKVMQEEREKSALNALYMSPSQIPDSPAEPTSQIPEDEVDTNMKHMLSGNEVRELDRGDREPAISVQGLISQLAGASASVTGDPVDVTAVPQPVDLKQLGFDLSLFAQLAAQQSAQGSAPAPNGFVYPQQSYSGEQTWNNQYSDYGQAGYEEDSNQRSKNWDGQSSDQGWRGRGRGGRGGGTRGGFRNTKRKLCNFYANGRRASKFQVRQTEKLILNVVTQMPLR
jgi:protein phosphatase 1 regulatory subunit 10